MTKEAQVITVAMTEKDTYGNLKVTDNLGNEYKIGGKRSQLFEVFVQGRAVKITWDNYMNKDYISDAEPFNPETEGTTAGGIEVASATAPKPTPKATEKPAGQSELKNRSFAVSYAKDLVVAGVIAPDRILSYAEYFARYMDGSLEVEDKDVASLLLK